MVLKVSRDLPSANRLFHHILVTVHQIKMFLPRPQGLTEEVFVLVNDHISRT